MNAWLSAFAALPTLIKLIFQIITMLEKQFGPDWAGKLTEASLIFDKLETAKTPEERQQSAKDLSGIFNRI